MSSRVFPNIFTQWLEIVFVVYHIPLDKYRGSYDLVGPLGRENHL